ncbi:unnamed protein product [Linum tenue]|uniref:AAA+ ATPase domain-containing protein n=1 Tax=Linum tenue TaxID=586396 RepID=A0AAV0NT63_9ROSI|nr:unnamed protein product [Linum tenue]
MFTTMTSSDFASLIKGRKLDPGLLKRLNVAMLAINQLIEVADEKQLIDDAIRSWVAELKDAAYDADDFIDELGYEAIRAEAEAASQTATGKMLSFFSYRNPFKDGINGKLKKLLERLDGLIKLKNTHGLDVDTGNKVLTTKPPTTSLVLESCIYGREADKETIMNLLLSNDRSSDDLGVITIVGTGGVGKTTLAKLMYNDSKVQEHFQVSAWICVSEEFDVNKITKDILEELSGKASDNRTLHQLQIELRGRLTQKKFLLILDDVWNESDREWDLLQTPLKYGAKGSKIIATTRHLNVASVMSTTDTYHLNPLTSDDCWMIFSSCASLDGNLSARPELETVGRQLVEKCQGLPLAARTLGALLHTEQDVEKWEKILKSNLWDLHDEILPALILSYQYLPSYLKQCFAYCAIFPKDYRFQKEELVLLWMSEGFISSPEVEKEFEEIASEYFDQLVSRSFFQQSSGMATCFTMHGLIHDLSEYVSGEFCFQLDGNDLSKITTRTRHLRYARTTKDASRKIEAIWWNVDYKSIDNDVINGLLSTLSNLRVLSFYGYKVVELPNSIGNLKHLRYLNLSLTCIKELPAMICTLYNLQKTKLQEMPLQIGKLTKLQCLTDFFVGKRSGSSIKDLEELHHLRETLRIWNLQNVVDSADTFGSPLKSKKDLKRLELRWDGDADDSSHEVMLMEKLQPYVQLSSLNIDGYRGTTFPVWVGDSAFTHIVTMELAGCKNCYCLPSLGQLVSLEKLSIKAFDSLRTIGEELYVSTTSTENPFRSLKTLEFEDMPEWEELTPFVAENVGDTFPLLEQLYLTNCPKLRQTVSSHLPSLETLRIRDCQLLRIPSLPSKSVVFKMELRDMSRSLMLELFPKLKSLSIKNCESLESLCNEEEIPKDLDSLTSVRISECPKLVSFPKGGLPARNLNDLALLTCSTLTCLPDSMDSHLPSLMELTVGQCPEIECFPEGGLPSKLQILKICACDKLVAGHMQWNLQSLPSLLYFSIDSNKELESFPEETLLPCTLTTLGILSIQNLKSLDEQGIQQLSALKELKISACPNLESFPIGDLLPTLESLEIISCDKLVSGRSQWNLQAITSLLQLKFFENDEVESLTREMMLPSSLVSLEIRDLYSLKSLEGLQQLTSLRDLKIYRCPDLMAIPEEGLPSSLSSMSILRCPFLEQRCQQDKGEDWSKISHIPNLEIGHYNI